MSRKNWPWWRNNPIDLKQARLDTQLRLNSAGNENPANSTLVLLGHVLNQSKSWLLAHTEYQLTPSEQIRLEQLLDKFLSGKPLPYLLEEWSFFGRSFIVTPDVLIPRPETELLVEKAIEHAKTIEHPAIVDVGTGSGIIAISLAAELPNANVTATDLSMRALKVAQQNAHRHDQRQIQFVATNLLAPLLGSFNLICANLPYIPTQTLEELAVIKYEPRLALDGGIDGLAFISPLLAQAKQRLTSQGVLLMEIESSQGEQVMMMAKKMFPEAECHLYQDIAGLDRLVEVIQD